MIPIVTYHAVGDAASPLWTPIRLFEAQLAAFSAAGYRTVSLASAVASLRAGAPLVENALAITFDDGYESVYREAWPRLRAHGFSATVFLISDFCGCDNRWPGQPSAMPVAPLMSWEQASALAADGCELGAHTRNHVALSTVPLAVAQEEIFSSRLQIEARTGQIARVFSYPYGATNASITDLVRRQFDGAVGTRLGLAVSASDPFLLPRIDAWYLTPSRIARMQGRLFQGYLELRQALRTVRRWIAPDWRPISTQ